ncbi:ribosome biogenesis GTP-binding protein YihA/YsxC [Rickettsiella massiliensis]|uniref:ribosome biogenesis GTP-binding protein YihA/YsxC n=1 Tax=Rickettsiella massiliensis TaxID=676517 RepID=UPI000299E32A|nr:ribosome biogenesis GTP-binding protein YihA/YsxC [Rickettsiella massiliensis]
MRTISFPPTTFLKSAAKLNQLPPDNGSEVAFIGRSNSGKSSAINAITGIKGLAKTSKTPGRTQLLNFFTLDNPQQRLVDLPGYGFARVDEQQKQDWEAVIADYLQTRQSLKGLVITMDSRHPLKTRDQAMLFWAKHYAIPLYILLTKMDKLSNQERLLSHKTTKKTLNELSIQAEIQPFSVTKPIGIHEARRMILQWLNNKPTAN